MVQETSNANSDRRSNELVWNIVESIIWDWNDASVVLVCGLNQKILSTVYSCIFTSCTLSTPWNPYGHTFVNPTSRADWNAFQIGFILSDNINAMLKDIHFNFCEVCSTIAVRSSVGNSSRFQNYSVRSMINLDFVRIMILPTIFLTI